MSKHNIFLDMDGVLANWVKSVLKTFEIDVHEDEYDAWDAHKKWVNVTDAQFWNKIENTPNFWYDIEPYEWAKDFYNKLTSYGNVYICTTPSRDPECYSQKVRWCVDKLGIRASSMILMKNKYFLANTNSTLIDDKIENVNKFIEHGGRGLLFKQSWNMFQSQAPALNIDDIYDILENDLYMSQGQWLKKGYN